jgi:hypothetical protein
MSKLNRLKFDELHIKTQEDAEAYFRVMSNFPKAVGFDKKSQGFLCIHKRHSPSGLENEIPACLILKKLGYAVEFCEEYAHRQSYDALIDGIAFEIKRLSKVKNLLNGITLHFRRTYEKCPHLIIHIDQRVDASNLRRVIRQVSEEYQEIRKLLLIYRYKVVLLDREMMKKANYDL